MIRLRSAQGRRDGHDGNQERSVTFNQSDNSNSSTDGFGVLAVYCEIVLPPGVEFRWHATFDGETVVYVRRGSIRCVDSRDTTDIIRAGVFTRTSARRGDCCTYGNESPTRGAQIVAIGMHLAQPTPVSSREQTRVTSAQRRSTLCIVASPDGRQGSLRLARNCVVYSAILMRGQRVVHEVMPGRRVWLQVIEGELSVGDVVVAAAGDGVAVSNERAVSITAREGTEILLIDIEGG